MRTVLKTPDFHLRSSCVEDAENMFGTISSSKKSFERFMTRLLKSDLESTVNFLQNVDEKRKKSQKHHFIIE